MKYDVGFVVTDDMTEDDIIDQVLFNRGIIDKEGFLHPSESMLLPLDSLQNIEDGYFIIKEILDKNEPVCILSDTDVDGISAAACSYRWCKQAGMNPTVFINHGKDHGLMRDNDYYEKIKSDYKYLLIVDSLNSTVEEYKDIAESGVKILVLDHHAIDPEINYDDYVTLISSQRNYGNPQLSGAGVVLKFCMYLDEKFGTNYSDSLYDLCACGLVADVMDMTVPENRYLVWRGLQEIHTLAIKKMIGGFEFNAEAISFSVAPLINAANRMDENEAALKAFLTDDNKECLACMRILKKCKEQQNVIADEKMLEAEKLIEDGQVDLKNKVLIFKLSDVNSLSGLVATKLVEKYKHPVIVTGDNYFGSLRSMNGINLMQAVNDSGFGWAKGHEEAAGFGCEEEDIQCLNEYLNKNVDLEKTDASEFVDFQIEISGITNYLAEKIKEVNYISGKGFKPIKVMVDDIGEFEVNNYSNHKHLVLACSPYFEVIKWNSGYNEQDFEDASMFQDQVSVVGKIQRGYIGRNLKTQIIADEIMIK